MPYILGIPTERENEMDVIDLTDFVEVIIL